MNCKFNFTTLASLLLLSACGGSGDTRAKLTEPLSFLELQNEQVDQLLEISQLTFTPLSEVPDTGSATYSGVLEANSVVQDQVGDGIIGQLSLDIRFRKSGLEISGGVTDIFSSGGDELEGILAITSGGLDRQIDPTVDHTVSVGIAGSLQNGSRETSDYLLQLEGDFFGPSSGHVGGVVLGRAQKGSGIGQVRGRFTAKNMGGS